MSAWGKSWGRAWGNSWGIIEPVIVSPWDKAPIQPGAFAPLSRPSSPITKVFQRRTRRRREQEMLLL